MTNISMFLDIIPSDIDPRPFIGTRLVPEALGEIKEGWVQRPRKKWI